MQSPWWLDASLLVQTYHRHASHARLCTVPETSVSLIPQGLGKYHFLWLECVFPALITRLHPELIIFSVTLLLEVNHRGPWASLPAHSCQGCQEHRALATLQPDHVWWPCLWRAILRAEVASCMPLTIKTVNSWSVVFLFWNTTRGVYWHGIWVCHGTWGGGWGGQGMGTWYWHDIILVLLTVLWEIQSFVSGLGVSRLLSTPLK